MQPLDRKRGPAHAVKSLLLSLLALFLAEWYFRKD
jgi:hypothetical protein